MTQYRITVHTYTIATDSDSQTIAATTPDEAATLYDPRCSSAEELRAAVVAAGGYGSMTEEGVEIWRVSASAEVAS